MSDHSLIENHNHVSNRLLTPDESLPRILGDTEDQLVASKVYESQVKETIRGLNKSRMRFNRKGKITIRIVVDDELQDVELAIRALPGNVLEKIQEEFQDEYVLIPERWEKEAVWDADQEVWVPGHVQNHDDPDYPVIARKLARLLRKMNYEKAVYGLADPFMDGNRVIWHSEQTYKAKVDGVVDTTEAIEYLNEMGITYEQVQYIANEVDKLSAQSSIASMEEFKKKAEQVSESHTD